MLLQRKTMLNIYKSVKNLKVRFNFIELNEDKEARASL